ncbi:hypothetical protein [Pseudoroseomonas cervicalis]|uniref:hypothetical protein n=1 Tax=Teichococcus cervicalis TaxID=204525 RepID=UPI0022F1C376|nr:hypothetical protein [Pseudoroseomonas cervicalis]WBV44234.1 hypothetical protein PFY06_06645 [Pseudoroseomonas cervicalis]
MATPPRPGPGSTAPRRTVKPARGASPSRRFSWRAAVRDFPWRRWLAVLICVAVLLIGIPLAVAFVGDLGALLLLVGVGGFALGRATAPRPAAQPPRKGRGGGGGRA